MPIYRDADEDADQMVADLIFKHYPKLQDAGVTVRVLLADPTDADGPTLMRSGDAVAAFIKVNSQKERVQGLKDCTIVLDSVQWDGWGRDRQRAVLDHELYHLTLVLDKEGKVKTDDCGRPKLKCRGHDWAMGGFEEIVRRHGQASLEYAFHQRLKAKMG